MSASALTSVNGSSARVAHIVAYGSTVTLSLVSTNDVRTCTFKILSDSHGSVSFPDITDVSLGNATFTMPADPSTGAGWGFLCQTIVNENTSTQSIWTFVVGATSTAAIVPIPPGETTERNARLGWLEVLNQLLGATSSGIGDLGAGNFVIGSPTGNQIRPAAFTDVTGSLAVAKLTTDAGADGASVLIRQSGGSTATWINAGLSNNLVFTTDAAGIAGWNYLNENNFDLSVGDHTVMLTANGNVASFAKISNAYVSDVAWSKITGVPAATGSTSGVMSATDKTNLDALFGASVFTFDDLHLSLPSAKTLVVNLASGNSNLLMQSTDAHTVSIDAEFGTTAGTYTQGNDARLVDGKDSATFRRRTLQVSGSDRVVGYENAYIFTGTTGVTHTITIAETEWQGTGTVDPTSNYHVAHIETEIVLTQQDFISTRSVHRSIIYKLRTGGVSWSIGNDGGTRDSTEDTPAGATIYINCNLTLSGTNNGDLNLNIQPTGAVDPKSEVIVFVKVHGGGKYA